ncbi:glycosyltransferase family 2 protein [Polynucleobacter paneuropaeus]|nr:glycosyltransferase family 2 protein [Polynucleobacter paneuropaeus]
MTTHFAPLSILVLTKNEEQDLPRCLNSISFSDDIHVFDSFSDDRTIQIACEKGATVTQRAFDDFSSQRNAALDSLNFKYSWVFILDADEEIPDGLRDEITLFLRDVPADIVACRIRRRDYFLGTWLKHAQISPFYIRLIRRGKVRYERKINEVLKVSGNIADFKEYFDHFSFSKGIEHWVKKHNQYSTMEAELIADGLSGGRVSWKKAFFSNDFNVRRFHQKEIFYMLPFRPLVKWIYMMFFRGAILDGYAGITYSFLQAIYEYMIVLKTMEIKRRRKGLSL